MSQMRVRKAWECKVKRLHHDPAIYYAETASKARYQCFLDASECYDVKLPDIEVWRRKGRDVTLPPRHWLLDHLTAEQAHIVLHSFGGNHLRAGYRDYFYAGFGHTDLHRLTFEFGLFEVYREDTSGICFGLTELGKIVAASMVSTYPRQ